VFLPTVTYSLREILYGRGLICPTGLSKKRWTGYRKKYKYADHPSGCYLGLTAADTSAGP
jgi:hypothetical protein